MARIIGSNDNPSLRLIFYIFKLKKFSKKNKKANKRVETSNLENKINKKVRIGKIDPHTKVKNFVYSPKYNDTAILVIGYENTGSLGGLFASESKSPFRVIFFNEISKIFFLMKYLLSL